MIYQNDWNAAIELAADKSTRNMSIQLYTGTSKHLIHISLRGNGALIYGV
jgi:hypothetical protein